MTGSLAERASERKREREEREARNACARDVSSRGSGVNYFTILFKETRVRNLRNEIPRRLAEAWLIFYRRPVYPISRAPPSGGVHPLGLSPPASSPSERSLFPYLHGASSRGGKQ